MKKLRNFWLGLLILYTAMVNAQSPSLMSYQAVIWDAAGNLVVEKDVNIRLSILQGTATGQAVYVETHRPRTNANGLVSLLIGGGNNVSGKIVDIKWGEGNFFLKTETDPAGGTNFSITGTNQLVSVPYAFASNISEAAKNISTKNTSIPGQLLMADKDGTPIWVSTKPTLSTTNLSNITPNTAISGGNVIFDGGSPITDRGVVWSTVPDPTISLSTKTSEGTGTGTFTSNLTGLSSNTTYYLRAFATNSVGTSYGNEFSFTTVANIPILTTTNISSISNNSATTGGMISSDGGSPVLDRGVVWSTSPTPTIALSTRTSDGTGIATFKSNISGLIPNTTYYVRAYASNAAGTGYGNEVSFKTLEGAIPPTVTTSAASEISYTTFTSGGEVIMDGGADVVARGIVWSQTEVPTVSLSTKTINGKGIGVFKSFMFDLTPNTTYYIRAYATNSAGTGYGKLDTVRTRTWVNCPNTVKDIDNNIYNVVSIGYQCWTKENLKVSRYRNGESIPVIISDKVWESQTSGMRCWFNNDSTKFEEMYGNLYNWYAVADSRGLCPPGWHVPTDDEWSTLTDYLGGRGVAGGKMKSTGTTSWNNPNIGATNESGFSALPGGYRYSRGNFVEYNNRAKFFSSTEHEGGVDAWFILLLHNTGESIRAFTTDINVSFKSFGASVRCIRD